MDDTLEVLREEFRHHLEVFYASLKLAPPYHSVEKAIAQLTTRLKAMDVDERNNIASDSIKRWIEYRRAFIESGLHKKHRGIIVGLTQSTLASTLPSEYSHFLETFSA
jgi:hypothetical protein